MEPIFYQDPSDGGFAGAAGARRAAAALVEHQQYHKLHRHQRAAPIGTRRAIGRNSRPPAPLLDGLPPPSQQQLQQQQHMRGKFYHQVDSSGMMAPTSAVHLDSNDDDGETSSASEDSALSAGYPSPQSRASRPTILSSSIGSNKRPAADGGPGDHLPPAQKARMKSVQEATTKWSPATAGTSPCSSTAASATSPGSAGGSREQQRQLPRLAALETRPLAVAVAAAAPAASHSQLQHHRQQQHQQQMMMQQSGRAGEVKITPLMQLGGLPPSLLNNHSNNGRISPQHQQQQQQAGIDSPMLLAQQQQRRAAQKQQQQDSSSTAANRRTHQHHLTNFQNNIAAAAVGAGADPYGEVPPSPSWSSCHSSHHHNDPRLPRQVPRLESLGDTGSAFPPAAAARASGGGGGGGAGMPSSQGRWDSLWSAGRPKPASSRGSSFDHSNNVYGAALDQGYSGGSRREEFPRQQQQESWEEASRIRETRASSVANVRWERDSRETMVARGGAEASAAGQQQQQQQQQRGSSPFERYHDPHNEPHAYIQQQQQQPRTVLSNHRPESRNRTPSPVYRTPPSVPGTASRTAENAEQPRWSPASQPNLVTGAVHQQQPQSRLPRRGAKQILESYVTHLNPKASREVWSHDEEEVLWRAQREYGNVWGYIAGLLPGRSENAVKNHWYTQMRMYYKNGSHSAKGNTTRQARSQKKQEEDHPAAATPADQRPRKNGGEERHTMVADKGMSPPTSPVGTASNATTNSRSGSPAARSEEEASATRAEHDARAEAVAALGMLFSQGNGRRLAGNNKDNSR